MIWSNLANQWQQVGSPQRPCVEDVELLFKQAFQAPLTHVGLLGVTPELVDGPWPQGTRLQAFDRSAVMIQSHWNPKANTHATAHQAVWHDLPLESAALSLVIGDGCTTQFPDCNYYTSFFSEMRRVLNANGALVMRCFLRQGTPTDQKRLVQEAMSGNIENFGSLKWQLAMALTNPTTLQVEIQLIRQVFDELFPDRQLLAKQTGWALETINSIDAYSGDTTTYTFPSYQDFSALCNKYFDISSTTFGSYEMAKSCPILRLTPRNNTDQGES